MNSYKLFWDEFSGWYLEIIKPDYKQPVDKKTYEATIDIFDRLLHIIHPFMPFITEEIWHLISDRVDGESLMVSRLHETKKYNKELVVRFDVVKELISAVRTIRKEKQILMREQVDLLVRAEKDDFNNELLPVIKKMCNLSEVSFVSEKPGGAASFMVGTTEFYIPIGDKADAASEIIKIMADLEYNRGFLANVMKKLDNERFVQNAPANVLELERKKQSDAESKIKSLEEALKDRKSVV